MMETSTCPKNEWTVGWGRRTLCLKAFTECFCGVWKILLETPTQAGGDTDSLWWVVKCLKEPIPPKITYRNIWAWEEHSYLFFKSLLVTGTSTDLTLIFWEKSNKPKALFSTVRESNFFYIKGNLNSEALSHCPKSQSLFKNPNQVSNCWYLTSRVTSGSWINGL